MISNQEQHEIETTVEALRKRQRQVRKAIERGYFSSTPEGHQMTIDALLSSGAMSASMRFTAIVVHL